MRNVALVLLCCASSAFAQEKKGELPRITAVSPLSVEPGEKVLLKIRGVKLSSASAVRFSGAPEVQAEIKEKKAAEVPNGLDGKIVGDTVVEAEITLSADFAQSALAFTIVAPEGKAEGSVQVRAKDSTIEEKEPNNGFAEAQPISFDVVVSGRVKEDKDVDVFRVDGSAGRTLSVEVLASCCGSLLDPAVTLFDARGRVLASSDDHGSERDPQLRVKLPGDGVYFLALNDANDRGGSWHNYELVVKEIAP